jgi:hypothetical protein
VFTNNLEEHTVSIFRARKKGKGGRGKYNTKNGCSMLL